MQMFLAECQKFLVAAIVCSSLAPVQAADAWPRFRGPSGDGTATTGGVLPVQWDSQKNISWRRSLPGEGWSSPVVGEGTVYLSAAIPTDDGDATDFDLSLILVDAESGEIQRVSRLMRQDVDDAAEIHSKNSHASPTPILAGERVYVHFGYQGTACTSRNGELIWTQRELSFPPVHGNGGSPILVDDKLVFTCDGGDDPFIVALNAKDGSVAWRTPRPVDAARKFSFCTPTRITVNGKDQIVAPGSDCVVGLDPNSGDVIWEVRYDGYSVIPKPVFNGEYIFVATGFNRPKLMAIRPEGHGDVTESHVAWEFGRGVPKTPSVIVYEGMTFLVSDDGIATCLDATSGEVLGQQRLGGSYSASPLLVGDRLYFTSESGVTTVVKASPDLEKIAENDLGERTLASLAAADGAIFLRTAEALYRIED